VEWVTAAVREHAGLVFSSARRRVGDGHLAEDVAQAVFLILSQKRHAAARSEQRTGSLAGWLLKTTRYVAQNALRRERRRLRHEQAASHGKTMMTHNASASGGGFAGDGLASSDPSEVIVWRELAPLLDDAVLSLSSADRAAVILRFFESRPIAEVAAALGVSRDAAKQRLGRALHKLRRKLERRGVEVPALTLAGLMTAYAVRAAPPHVVSMCSSATAGGIAATTAAGILAKGTLTMMNTMKLTTAGAMVLATGTAVGLFALAGGAIGNGDSTGLRTAAGMGQSSATRPATGPAEGRPGLVLEGEVAPWPEALTKPLGTPLSLNEVPLDEAIAMLRERMGLSVFADWTAMELEGVDRKMPITLDFAENISTGRALEFVLRAASGGFAQLGYDWDGDVLVISTAEEMSRHVKTMVVDLRPIAGRGEEQVVDEETVQQIIKLITETVHMDSWRENGGSASIQAVSGRLVVTAPPRLLRDVLKLVEKLGERGAQGDVAER
jgi:RNA polymerase sigma factor (sigma-70 family)